MFKKSYLLLLAFTLFGCGVNPENLDRPSTMKAIYFSNPVDLIEQDGVKHLTLSKGEYISVGVDKKGTYFLGPPGCITHLTMAGEAYADGGVLIPFKKGELPDLFSVVGSNSTQKPSEINNHDLAVAINPAPLTVEGGVGTAAGIAIADAISRSVEYGRYRLSNLNVDREKLKAATTQIINL